ncbi:unnamed protein product [Vicia faba]|uniref:Uncharacterized protein n=1 Tax=Vicia faba TaxID=3906 RepID=A0AAV0ZHI5_VICFA|nr:unnamed protein product [Vicia faba]
MFMRKINCVLSKTISFHCNVSLLDSSCSERLFHSSSSERLIVSSGGYRFIYGARCYIKWLWRSRNNESSNSTTDTDAYASDDNSSNTSYHDAISSESDANDINNLPITTDYKEIHILPITANDEKKLTLGERAPQGSSMDPTFVKERIQNPNPPYPTHLLDRLRESYFFWRPEMVTE